MCEEDMQIEKREFTPEQLEFIKHIEKVMKKEREKFESMKASLFYTDVCRIVFVDENGKEIKNNTLRKNNKEKSQ